MNKLLIALNVIKLILELLNAGRNREEAVQTTASVVNLPVEEVIEIFHKYLKFK